MIDLGPLHTQVSTFVSVLELADALVNADYDTILYAIKYIDESIGDSEFTDRLKEIVEAL